MEDNTNYSGIGKKTLIVVYVALVAVCCLAGLALKSFGLFADGVITLLFLSDLLKGDRKRFIPSTVISVVGLILGLYVAIAGFFNLSATIGYADAAASICVFPLFVLILLVKVSIVAFSEAGSHNRADGIFGLVITLLVIAGTVATFSAGHYFEPAVAAAVGVYAIYKSVKNIFKPKEYPDLRPEDEKNEGHHAS